MTIPLACSITGMDASWACSRAYAEYGTRPGLPGAGHSSRIRRARSCAARICWHSAWIWGGGDGVDRLPVSATGRS